MTIAKLKSPAEAEPEIAELFRDGDPCTIFAREEGAFVEEGWLQLGTISLPGQAGEGSENGEPTAMIKLGAFEWRPPDLDTLQKELKTLLEIRDGDPQARITRVSADIASIAMRAGLLQPVFDPAALEEMPYSRSTTVVSDTSGVLQGGLDFVARHLHPAARVKIPAIVHMELVNSADRFFRVRRSRPKKKGRRVHELVEHLKSQGGQRALLRLELQADTEIERTFLLGDPLRSAFTTDRERDLSELNISEPIKSYVDRLILEAARHHQAQSGPTHKVRLLTSDQGLARMALAEGISPLYFSATKAMDFFGAFVTGRTLNPFTGDVQGVSLSVVLWELATAFGAACLANKNKCTFTVAALGNEMTWSPYHSLDDLLWCVSTAVADESLATDVAAGSDRKPVVQEDERVSVQSRTATSQVTFFRFDVGRLFRLICILDDNQTMPTEEVVNVVGTKHSRGLDDYRRFLVSANLVLIEGEVWQAQPTLAKLSAALRNERVEEIRESLLASPSFDAFATFVGGLETGQTVDRSHFGRSAATYRTLGEVTLICADVQGEGIYPTPTIPDAAEFVALALKRYSELEGGDGLVAAGAWLESLIRNDGIHPEIARRRLDEASEQGLLRRSTEGSTLQIRNDDHILHVLRTRGEVPTVMPVHLYRGDYLIPGKASVSLRVEGVH